MGCDYAKVVEYIPLKYLSLQQNVFHELIKSWIILKTGYMNANISDLYQYFDVFRARFARF